MPVSVSFCIELLAIARTKMFTSVIPFCVYPRRADFHSLNRSQPDFDAGGG